MTKKSKDEEQVVEAPELAAALTLDELDDAFDRFEYLVAYAKRKVKFQGKPMTEWKRHFKVVIPEGAGLPEIDIVLRNLASKYHKASTNKHNAECAAMATKHRAERMFRDKVGELQIPTNYVDKGRKKTKILPLAEAERRANRETNIIEAQSAAMVSEMCVKMWEEILRSLSFTGNMAKSIQIGQMSENKMLGNVKGNIV